MVELARLRLVRQRKALTQQQLADRAGINRVTVARVESGTDEPFPTTIRKLADALGVEPEDLMSFDRATAGLASDHRPTVKERQDAERWLRDQPELAAIVHEAMRQIPAFISDARLGLELLADPDHGDDEQLFLGIATAMPETEAQDALRRFDREWWIPKLRRASGRVCIDLIDE